MGKFKELSYEIKKPFAWMNPMICTLFIGQTSKEGIFMHYNYEFKRKYVDMYRHGQYLPSPDGLSDKEFHRTVRKWVRIDESCGSDAL